MLYRTLFQLGAFKAHSGQTLQWKIECDALSMYDLECLAYMTQELVAPFGIIEGVPKGGHSLAHWLKPYKTKGSLSLLIVDDVLSTGQSMEVQRAGRKAMGVVIFARGPCPKWITPIFQMSY